MKMRPISASEAIRGRQLLPSSNRFEVLRGRDSSSPSGFRGRSASAKRKASDSEAASQHASKRSNTNQVPVSSPDMFEINKKLECLQMACHQITEDLGKANLDPSLDSILRCIAMFMNTSFKL